MGCPSRREDIAGAAEQSPQPCLSRPVKSVRRVSPQEGVKQIRAAGFDQPRQVRGVPFLARRCKAVEAAKVESQIERSLQSGQIGHILQTKVSVVAGGGEPSSGATNSLV